MDQQRPIKEDGGLNVYGFCDGDPINSYDYLGLQTVIPPKPVRPSKPLDKKGREKSLSRLTKAERALYDKQIEEYNKKNAEYNKAKKAAEQEVKKLERAKKLAKKLKKPLVIEVV